MEERAKLITETGLRLFKERGYDQVTVLDICQACGMTKPTFYKYITSKENILVSMFKAKEENILPEVQKLKEEGKLLAALWKGLTCSHEVALEIGPDLMSKYLSYLLRYSIPSYRYQTSLQDLMVEILETLQEQGEITSLYSPKDLYYALGHMDQGTLLSWVTSSGSFNLQKGYENSVIAILNLKDPSKLQVEKEELN